MWVSDTTAAHYKALQREETLLLTAGRKAWQSVLPEYPVESWRAVLQGGFMDAVAAQQVQAATLGASYSAGTLADQGFWVAPNGWVDPRAFAGVNPVGGNLERQLLEPAYRVERAIRAGAPATKALSAAENLMFWMLVNTLQNTSRAAAGIDIALRDSVGYVRVVHASACNRCLILAGKFYRWNQGFLRHPNCRCEHEATSKSRSKGLLDDPYEAFNRLSRAEQDARFGKAGAEAIREGADIFQVVNARRGMTKTKMFTTDGTMRGHARGLLKPHQRRLTPEAIYKQARGNRVVARELLAEHGYLLRGGQVPGGVLRGRVEGFGQMGKGGRAKAAREAVLKARATGVRDPLSRYTMTAAERRLYDAETRYRIVLEGRNPFASPALGRSASSGAPLTPQIAAMVERDYRRWLATGGEKFAASIPSPATRLD